ncbi:MAG: aldo/keto reductase [Bryobacteraceae bacterium]
MNYCELGKTGLTVSRLSFGASSLAAVFHPVDECDAIAAVHAALDCGINYFDVAPAYGGMLAEKVLGKALMGVPRSRYYLSTKVGKHTCPGTYGSDSFDYSRSRIRASVRESAARLQVDYFDIVHIHDIEYQDRRHTEWALTEGYESVCELKREGLVGGVSFGIYPLDLWERILRTLEIDAALVHNHYCLNDTGLLELLPVAQSRGVGIINGSPFASGLLTNRGAPNWHPATPHERRVFEKAASFCREEGTSLSRLALQFATRNPDIPTTLFSTANPLAVQTNVRWCEEPLDASLLLQVLEILAPVRDQQWIYT